MPEDTGYINVVTNYSHSAGLKRDGTISLLWNLKPPSGPLFSLSGSGYIGIAASSKAFAALNIDGTITAWGDSDFGGDAPSDNGYVSITSNWFGFAALKADGSITGWGKRNKFRGGSAPTDSGYISLVSNLREFAALKADGTISSWGGSEFIGDREPPTEGGYVDIVAAETSFAALKSDGSISTWRRNYSLFPEHEVDTPTDTGYVKIIAGKYAFTALKADGSVTTWGRVPEGEKTAPVDNGYIHIASIGEAFAALKKDGSVSVWGSQSNIEGAPTDNGYVSINGSRPGLEEDCSVSLSRTNQWKSGKTVHVGDTLLFSAIAKDIDDDLLTYSIDNIPEWASFDPLTGTLSGKPGSDDIGIFTVVISVSDGEFTSSLEPLVITVAIRDYDQDGVADSVDAFPYDADETLDTDNDGIGNKADLDDDNDGVVDLVDAFPLDVNEFLRAGDDNDNDGISDSWEVTHGLDPFDSNDANIDVDGDNVINLYEFRANTDPQREDSDDDGGN